MHFDQLIFTSQVAALPSFFALNRTAFLSLISPEAHWGCCCCYLDCPPAGSSPLRCAGRPSLAGFAPPANKALKVTLDENKTCHLEVGDKDGQLPGAVAVHHLAHPLRGRGGHDGETPGGPVPVSSHHCTHGGEPHPLKPSLTAPPPDKRREQLKRCGLVAEHLSPQPPPTAARLPKVAAAAPPRRLLGSRVEVEQSSSSSSTPGPDRSKMLECGGADNLQLSYVNLHLFSS